MHAITSTHRDHTYLYREALQRNVALSFTIFRSRFLSDFFSRLNARDNVTQCLLKVLWPFGTLKMKKLRNTLYWYFNQQIFNRIQKQMNQLKQEHKFAIAYNNSRGFIVRAPLIFAPFLAFARILHFVWFLNYLPDPNNLSVTRINFIHIQHIKQSFH